MENKQLRVIYPTIEPICPPDHDGDFIVSCAKCGHDRIRR
jgi:hypothetical protein